MALEDIFQALDEQAAEETDSVLRVAKAQAAALEREAREQAEREKTAALEDAETVARAKAERLISTRRVRAARELAVVRSEAIDAVFDEAERRLADLRLRSNYPGLLEALTREAVAGVEGGYEIQVAAGDAALVDGLKQAFPAADSVVASLDGAGGVVVLSDGGRLIRRNTFESRLARVRSGSHGEVGRVLGA